MTNLQTQGAIAFDAAPRDFLGLIGGIVQHLYFEQTRWIIQPRNGLDQPLHDVPFVIDRKLYSYLRPAGRLGGFAGNVGTMLGVAINQQIAMETGGREQSPDNEIRDHDGQVECVELVNSAEGIAAGSGDV